jgi:hypothetical protein
MKDGIVLVLIVTSSHRPVSIYKLLGLSLFTDSQRSTLKSILKRTLKSILNKSNIFVSVCETVAYFENEEEKMNMIKSL